MVVMEMTEPLLRVEGVSKRFGATRALTKVNFDVLPGEVHALMGENGAGKSTLMKIISGSYQPDSGVIEVSGERVSFAGPRDAQESGIAIIHQELNTIPEMTVAENLALGREPRTVLGVLDRKRMVSEARSKLRRVGSSLDPTKAVGSFSVGVQQMIEIARAIAEDARVLVLDEPTAALSRTETEQLMALIQQMRADGMGLIYISHRMEEVWELADRITVFRDGQHVATAEKGHISPQQVVKQMVGREVDNLYVRSDRPIGPPKLEVKDLTDGKGIPPASLEVRAGEVVSLVGLIGAGRTELARLIYGADSARGGTVRIDAKPYRSRSPRRSIKTGVSMLSEDRKSQVLFLQMSVGDNEGISVLDKFSTLGVVHRRSFLSQVRSTAERLAVRTASMRSPVSSLSGGNQQKVGLARMLLEGPDLIILDEPTRGVDIGAKHEIYEIIDRLALDGKAILIISSDLPEAIGISDRLLVMREGQIVANLNARNVSEEIVMSHATAVYEETT